MSRGRVLMRIILIRYLAQFLLVLIKPLGYAVAEPFADKEQTELSGDFMNFVKDMDSIVYNNHNAKMATREMSMHHTTTAPFTTRPHISEKRRNEKINTEKDALRDVLMMKLVSYYEDKYKLFLEDGDSRKINNENSNKKKFKMEVKYRINGDSKRKNGKYPEIDDIYSVTNDKENILSSKSREGYRIVSDQRHNEPLQNSRKYRISQDNMDKSRRPFENGEEYGISYYDKNNYIKKGKGDDEFHSNGDKYKMPKEIDKKSNSLDNNENNKRITNTNKHNIQFSRNDNGKYIISDHKIDLPVGNEYNQRITGDNGNKYRSIKQDMNNYRINDGMVIKHRIPKNEDVVYVSRPFRNMQYTVESKSRAGDVVDDFSYPSMGRQNEKSGIHQTTLALVPARETSLGEVVII